jgi:hypothetical protein
MVGQARQCLRVAEIQCKSGEPRRFHHLLEGLRYAKRTGRDLDGDFPDRDRTDEHHLSGGDDGAGVLAEARLSSRHQTACASRRITEDVERRRTSRRVRRASAHR